MWNNDDRRKFFWKLKLVGKLAGLLAILIFLLGMLVGITYGACYFLFKMSDHSQFITVLIILPIFSILGIVLEWPNLRKFKIGNYLNKNHIANKLIRGYLMAWGRFVLICWGGVLGLDILFIGGAIFLKSGGFSDNISMIIAALPATIFVICYIIWAKKYKPLSYRDFLEKNASVLEEKIIPSDPVRDLLSELDDHTQSKKSNNEPH